MLFIYCSIVSHQLCTKSISIGIDNIGRKRSNKSHEFFIWTWLDARLQSRPREPIDRAVYPL